jgi:hypothetical protein
MARIQLNKMSMAYHEDASLFNSIEELIATIGGSK